MGPVPCAEMGFLLAHEALPRRHTELLTAHLLSILPEDIDVEDPAESVRILDEAHEFLHADRLRIYRSIIHIAGQLDFLLLCFDPDIVLVQTVLYTLKAGFEGPAEVLSHLMRTRDVQHEADHRMVEARDEILLQLHPMISCGQHLRHRHLMCKIKFLFHSRPPVFLSAAYSNT